VILSASKGRHCSDVRFRCLVVPARGLATYGLPCLVEKLGIHSAINDKYKGDAEWCAKRAYWPWQRPGAG
jgi:hypothetical protein